MFQNEFHIRVSIVEKIGANDGTNDKINKIWGDIHLMNTPEKPWAKKTFISKAFYTQFTYKVE